MKTVLALALCASASAAANLGSCQMGNFGSCAARFNKNGGCTTWSSGQDPTSKVPSNCMTFDTDINCAFQLARFCAGTSSTTVVSYLPTLWVTVSWYTSVSDVASWKSITSWSSVSTIITTFTVTSEDPMDSSEVEEFESSEESPEESSEESPEESSEESPEESSEESPAESSEEADTSAPEEAQTDQGDAHESEVQQPEAEESGGDDGGASDDGGAGGGDDGGGDDGGGDELNADGKLHSTAGAHSLTTAGQVGVATAAFGVVGAAAAVMFRRRRECEQEQEHTPAAPAVSVDSSML
jgi:cytoskeletal protein RodZ